MLRGIQQFGATPQWRIEGGFTYNRFSFFGWLNGLRTHLSEACAVNIDVARWPTTLWTNRDINLFITAYFFCYQVFCHLLCELIPLYNLFIATKTPRERIFLIELICFLGQILEECGRRWEVMKWYEVALHNFYIQLYYWEKDTCHQKRRKLIFVFV